MTYEDEAEAKPPSIGTKVLVFGCAIFAVLGSFWAIVWFIRSYVEPPRVMLPAPMTLASGESRPAPAPARSVEIPAATVAAASVDAGFSAPRATPVAAPMAAAQADPSPTGGIADRWAPLSGTAPASPPSAPVEAPAPTLSAPAALGAPAPDKDAAIDEVAEGSVPAIAGRPPLPRRKPVQTASSAKRLDPPLPRPRPDGPAPQSVWTAVPTTDDRYPGE